jgi:hypothetical protein
MNTLKRYQIWIALAVLILPILARGLWFYRGIPSHPKIQAPDYAGASISQPPISTAVPGTTATLSGKVVVLDYSHINLYDPSDIQAFVSALTVRGARVEYDDGNLYLSDRLKYASAYIVISPTYAFSVDEANQVRRFAQRGGRLIVFTDPTHGTYDSDTISGNILMIPDVNAANSLLEPFGITFSSDYLYNLLKNEGNFRNVLFTQFGEDALTQGLSQVALYGAHSVSAENGKALITGDESTFSSLTDSSESPLSGSGQALAAAALSADGTALAFGDFTFLMPPYNQVADNSLLLGAIADFALGGTRTHTLADFPYLFGHQASLLTVGDLQMTADLLAPVASLQSALQWTNTSLVVAPKAVSGSDTIVLGLLTPSDDLDRYINTFDLGLEDSAAITIPGFGQIGRAGIGLMLYKPGVVSNTLILLTDLPVDLAKLIKLLASGDMSACVIQNNIGVCSIGYSGSTYDTTPPGEEVQPTETSTPSG